MTTRRWLLPFTWGVDMTAIDSVVRLAQAGEASLVAVSLISVPKGPGGRGARLEHIQQSKDFLEAVQYKSIRLQVQVERYEVFTIDVLEHIALLVRELHCDRIVLVSQNAGHVMLRPHEFKRLLLEPPASLVLLRMPAPAAEISRWGRFRLWLRRFLGQANGVSTAPAAPDVEGPLWIRMEEHPRG
jgi:hypothetical protein